MAARKGKLYEIVKITNRDGNTTLNRLPRKRSDVPANCKIYEYLTMYGDGCLKVPVLHLVRYGITRRISSSSHLGRTMASLKEGDDMCVLINAVLDAGKRFFYVTRQVERAEIGMSQYHPYWAENPLRSGFRVTLNNGQKARIIDVYRGLVKLETDDGDAYTFSSRRCVDYFITPPMTAFVIVHPDYGVALCDQYRNGTRDIIWSGMDPERYPIPPWSHAFGTIENCEEWLRGSDAEQLLFTGKLQYHPVEHDPWKLPREFVQMDTLVRTGIEPWSFSEE